MSVEEFFWYARERQAVLLRRRAGRPRPWTRDHALRSYRFCNVFREDDRTTEWFRTNVRDPLRDSPDVLLATVLFRWFNRISTGEAIFKQTMLDLGTSPGWGTDGLTVWEARESSWASDEEWLSRMRDGILAAIPSGPYVTGSYIIRGTPGFDKLSGVLDCVAKFMSGRWSVPGDEGGFLGSERPLEFTWLGAAQSMLACRRIGQPWTLEKAWRWLRQVPFLGDFMAYEIVTDLRHTALLDRAPDVQTWANPGPGAARGAGRMLHGDVGHFRPTQKDALISVMRDVVEWSRSPAYWPRPSGDHSWDGTMEMFDQIGDVLTRDHSHWPAWEMREAEHTLCEYDKWCRVRDGGRVKQVFR